MSAANDMPSIPGWGQDDPPHNYEAEMGLLGAIMVDNAVLADVQDVLLPEHFADPSHAKIYRACATLIERGETAGPVTLRSHFDNDRELEAIGGQAYLAQLMGAVWTTANAKDLAREIHDCFVRRQMIEIGHRMVARSRNWDLEWSGERIIEHAERELIELRPEGRAGQGFVGLSDAMSDALRLADEARRTGGHTGIPTGIPDLDDMTGGLHKGEPVWLGARPGMGKTGLLTSIATNAARAGRAVAFFSLEERDEMIANRILARMTGIDVHRIRLGKGLHESDIADLTEASRALQGLPLHIDDGTGLTVATIQARARKLRNQLGALDLIVLDHLRLIQPLDSRASAYDRINEASEGMKTMAKALDVAVLAAVQLNRAAEQRDDKRPSLSDLRQSGQLEEDARAVFFLYRDAYYEKLKEPKRTLGENEATWRARHAAWEQDYRDIERQAELIVAKQNNGPLGNVPLRFDPHSTAFEGVK